MSQNHSFESGTIEQFHVGSLDAPARGDPDVAEINETQLAYEVNNMLYSDDFFFSSRRRHTRFDCDWSSDVCSSDLTHLEGHAVRAMYACCGATDYYLETGDQSYWKTLNLLWDDLVSAQMYVTGGVGEIGRAHV